MRRLWSIGVCALSSAIAAGCGEDESSSSPPTPTVTTTGAGGTSQGGTTSSSGGTSSGGSTSSSGGSTSSGGSGSTGGTSAGGTGQGGEGAAAMACDEPNPQGAEIVALVNDYRQSEGLPTIPYSPSLSCVAVTHVHDLADHQPQNEPGCNLHSWSDQGAWTACCYTPDHAQAQCMWMKPQELTDYSGYGYENAAAGASTPSAAVAMWQNSSAHNDVILNQGIWASHPWHAVGAGMYQGYATLWFGEQADPAR